MAELPDFSLKPNFPIAGVAQLYADKRTKEEAIKHQQFQDLFQGLEMFQKGVGSLVERRNRIAQAGLQADILLQNPEIRKALGDELMYSQGDKPVASAGASPNPVAMSQTATPDAMGVPVPNLPVAPPQMASSIPANLKAMKERLTGAIGPDVKGDEFLKLIQPQMVDQTTFVKNSDGSYTQTTTKVPRGSKVSVVGSSPGGSSGFVQGKYMDSDGTPLNFNRATGQYTRPDGSPAVQPVLQKGDESAIGEANLMIQQLPNIDIVFNAYKDKSNAGARVQGTWLGGVLDPETAAAENSLKLSAFTFGGKNLTAQEKAVVYGALFPSWKDNDGSRESKRAIMKNYFTGKIDLLEAANLLGPAGVKMREMLEAKRDGAPKSEPKKKEEKKSPRDTYIQGAMTKGYSQIEAEHLADQNGFK